MTVPYQSHALWVPSPTSGTAHSAAAAVPRPDFFPASFPAMPPAAPALPSPAGFGFFAPLVSSTTHTMPVVDADWGGPAGRRDASPAQPTGCMRHARSFPRRATREGRGDPRAAATQHSRRRPP